MVQLQPPWWLVPPVESVIPAEWSASIVVDDGDDVEWKGGWQPGMRLRLSTAVAVDWASLRTALGVGDEARFLVDASWYSVTARRGGTLCRVGPETDPVRIEGLLPPGAWVGIHLERRIVHVQGDGDVPDGAVVWQDSWADRSRIRLEGSGPGFGVLPVEFGHEERHALWRVVVDAPSADTHLSEAARLLLNQPRLVEMFPGGGPDDLTAALMRADLLTQVTRVVLTDHGATEMLEAPRGSVGALAAWVCETLGDAPDALASAFEQDPAHVETRIRSLCLAEVVGAVR